MMRECKRGIITDVFIHKLADVSELATVLPGTKIWRWTHIDDYAYVGRNCMIAQNCYIAPGVKIGDNCRVQNNVSIFRGVKLEQNVFVGPSVVFTNVKVPKIFRQAKFYDTIIEDNVTIGAGAIIVCGITIGNNSFIGAGTVVTKDIPPFSLVIGNPGRVVKTLSADWKEFDGK